MFCTNCGKELPDGVKFCFVCGAKVIDSVEKGNELNSSISAGTLGGAKQPITFSVCGETISFDGSFRQYTSERKRFLAEFFNYISKQSALVQQEFQKATGSGSDNCLNVLSTFGGMSLDRGLDLGTDFLMEHHIYAIAKENLFDACVNELQNFYQVYSEFEEKYISITASADEMAKYRKLSYESRSRWSGGGFGVKGAIKGAAIAGVFNLGGSILSGIGNAVSGAFDNAKIQREKKMLYDSKSWVEECQRGLVLDAIQIFKKTYEFIGKENGIAIPRIDETLGKSYINNANRLGNTKQSLSVALMGINADPYNMIGYNSLFQKLGYLNIEVCQVVEYFLPDFLWDIEYQRTLFMDKFNEIPEKTPIEKSLKAQYIGDALNALITKGESCKFIANYVKRYEAEDNILWQGLQSENQKTAEQYMKDAEQGIAASQYVIGLLYMKGTGVPQDRSTGTQWLIKAVEQDFAPAQDALGTLYVEGVCVPRNNEIGIELITKAANQGYDEAQYHLGIIYEGGKICARNYEKAAEWYQKAADQGFAKAQCALGDLYLTGKGVQKNESIAIKWYQQAAEQGDAVAQYRLGSEYLCGKNLPSDYNKALEYISKAVEQNYAPAQFALGFMHNQGKGVPQDYNKALEYFTKAADQGNAMALNELGLMYATGRGVLQDYSKAYEYHKKAAMQGNVGALYNLGIMYENGRGVPQDYGKAVEYYMKAANKGHMKAKEHLDSLQKRGIF